MRKQLIALSTLAAFACVTCAEFASAQIYVPPGQEFYAAPLSHGGFALPGTQILAPAPVAAPVVVAPAPEPAPVKRRKRRR